MAAAQQDNSAGRRASSATIRATLIRAPVTLDGRLDEPFWAAADSVDDLNENWNGIWDVAVSRDSAGWTAEFRIPLLALRFHAGTNPEFGFNVRRFIRRKNEEDLWRSYGRAQGFYRLNNEGAITDLG